MAGLTTSGAYLLSGHDGPYALERFTCVGDGGSWSYDGVREDPATGVPLGSLALRVDGATVRLQVEAAGWVLRGAAAGGSVLWRRGSDEHDAAADGFTGTSPAHLVVAVRVGRPRLVLVEVTEPVLATRLVQRSWACLGAQEEVDVHEVADLATGERGRVHLAADVVVDAPGVRLVTLTRS